MVGGGGRAGSWLWEDVEGGGCLFHFLKWDRCLCSSHS